MKRLICALIVGIGLSCYPANAQGVFLNDHDEFEDFDFHVKQIEEFMLRFNLKELLVQPNQSESYARENRMLLFNKDYYLTHISECEAFLNQVEALNPTLHYEDSTWFAIAECDVLFQGKKDKVTLKLRTELVKEDIYKWSIVDANGEILRIVPKTQSDRIRLLPNDHEVNFIALQSATTANAQNITLFSTKSHKQDQLSVFNSLVYYKLLKVEMVNQLSYCFTQVPGYEIYVKKFIRDSKNAGWLISEIKKTSDSKRDTDIRINNEEKIEKGDIPSLFYHKLSEYAKNPSNSMLVQSIKGMFADGNDRNYIYGAERLYDDIHVYINKRSPLYAYIAISDYLKEIDNLSHRGKVLSFETSDIQVNKISDNLEIVTYKLCATTGAQKAFEYQAIMTIKDGHIQSIVPLEEDKL